MNYKILDRYPDYLIYEDGRIFSKKSNKFLKPQNNGGGYLKVNLDFDQVYIHRLVAEAFVENPDNLKYIDHINRIKSDNRCENLRWSTAKENIANTANKPRYSVSKKNRPHYSKEFIKQIKDEYENGAKVMELAKKYNMPRQSVSRFIKS